MTCSTDVALSPWEMPVFPAWETEPKVASVHAWRVEAKMATWAGWVDAYNGPDYDTMKERLGDMALTDSVTRVRVWRDGALYRSLEVTV